MSRMTYHLNFGFTPSQSQTKDIPYSSSQFLTLTMLIVFIFLSAFGVVYTKDLNRRLFIQYQELQDVQQQAQLDRGKLLLERSTLSAQGRILNLAHHRYGMVMPSRKHIVIVSE